MKKLSFKRLIAGLFTALVTLVSHSAYAQTATQCGLRGSAVASGAIQYDPFSSVGLTTVTIPLTLTRFVGTGGKKTQHVYFVLEKPAGSPNYQVLFTNGSTTSNVVYNVGGHPGLPTMNSNDAGQIYYNFGGAASPDTATFNVQVSVPAGADLSAGGNITFDIVYKCTGTGGLADVTTSTTLAQAVTINVNVLSALQASYVGSVLDFGEVGNKTTDAVLADPATYTRSGDIRVASSGAYEITMTSTNNYRLTYSGGNPATAAQSLAYNATLVGVTKTGLSGGPVAGQSPLTKICTRATVSGQLLPLKVLLTEGGSSKTPAPDYTDTLNVTVTPLVAATGASSCS